jgi:bacteriocin-like protein
MANQQTKKDGSQTIAMPTQELTDAELAAVTGGTRDVASGMPTGQRMHKPFAASIPAEPSSEG